MIIIRYAKIRSMDISNGPGICISLFVQGCSRHCPGCFNQDTWDFNGGKVWNRRTHFQFIDNCKKESVKNICILGGEPLDQIKDDSLVLLLADIKRQIKKPIWMWTGYTFEDIYFPSDIITNQSLNVNRLKRQQILGMIDILIDGPFMEPLVDKKLHYRGSSNQRVIDVKKSIIDGVVRLADRYY